MGVHKMGNYRLTCVGEVCLPKVSVPSKTKEGGGGKWFPHALRLFTKGFPVTLLRLLCQRMREGAQSPALGWHT